MKEEEVKQIKDENNHFQGVIEKISKENDKYMKINQELKLEVENLENFKRSVLGTIENETIFKNLPKENTKIRNFPPKSRRLPFHSHEVEDIQQIKFEEKENRSLVEMNKQRNFSNKKTPNDSVISNSSQKPITSNKFNNIDNRIIDLRNKLKNHKFTEEKNEKRIEDFPDKTRSQELNNYEISTRLFSECRKVLQVDDNLQILNLIKHYNNGLLSKEEAKQRVSTILAPYPNLMKDFLKLFE